LNEEAEALIEVELFEQLLPPRGIADEVEAIRSASICGMTDRHLLEEYARPGA
jgi:hypothetical protein